MDALPQTHDTPETCYDLMAGTGEIWPHVLKRYPDLKKVVAVDISSGMHKRALKRLHEMRSDKIGFIEDDVLASNLPAASADLIVSTFGLKTFNITFPIPNPFGIGSSLSRVHCPVGAFAGRDPLGQ